MDHKSQQVTCDRGTRKKLLFRSVTVYNKNKYAYNVI